VDEAVIKKRAEKMRELGKKKRQAFYHQFLHQELRVLVEDRREKETGRWKGFSRNYIPVSLSLESVSEEDFDLFLVDIALPDMNGDELVRQLKKQDCEASVVLITGSKSFQESIDALDIGIHDILLKPIAPGELIRVAKEALSSKSKLNCK
jgi:DNA-binding response OmpR family regulator